MKLSLVALSLASLFAAPAWSAPELGKAAPEFTLKDSNGKSHKLADFKGKTVVLEWLNHDCPFVKKHYKTGNMQGLQKELTAKGVVWLSVISSAKGKQGDLSPKKLNKLTQEKKAAPTAVLIDNEGKAGRAYEAKTTPHMFVINPEGNLAYMGAIDDKPSADPAEMSTGAGRYLAVAAEETLAGKPVSTPSTKPYGCSVKY